MPSKSTKEREHAFSIELKSKEYIKQVSISNGVKNTVLIEGFLGELEELGSIEGVMLEIKGVNGILRLDLKEEELKKWPSERGVEALQQGESGRGGMET